MLSLTTVSAARPSKECLVQGQSVQLKRVEVSGNPFSVDLNHVPAAATVPDRLGGASKLYVRGAVAFTGSRSLWTAAT
jgi:hypothetical protein